MSEEHEKSDELPPPTEKEAIFVQELTTHWNGARAARAAGANVEMARNIASEWRAKPHIAAHIDAHMKKRAEESKITAEALAEHLMRIVRADPRELIDYRIVNCRHCWGGGFRYQFTDGEMEVLLKEHAKPGAEKFDAKGGAGQLHGMLAGSAAVAEPAYRAEKPAVTAAEALFGKGKADGHEQFGHQGGAGGRADLSPARWAERLRTPRTD